MIETGHAIAPEVEGLSNLSFSAIEDWATNSVPGSNPVSKNLMSCVWTSNKSVLSDAKKGRYASWIGGLFIRQYSRNKNFSVEKQNNFSFS